MQAAATRRRTLERPCEGLRPFVKAHRATLEWQREAKRTGKPRFATIPRSLATHEDSRMFMCTGRGQDQALVSFQEEERARSFTRVLSSPAESRRQAAREAERLASPKSSKAAA